MLAWLQPSRPEFFAAERFPVFNLLVPEGRYYGFPIHRIPGFKFGRYHHLEEYIDPEGIDREPNLRDEQVLRDLAERYFPDGAGPTMTLKSCMFTNTPDHHFIIDLHPRYPQVSFYIAVLGPRLQVRQRDRRDHGRPGRARRVSATGHQPVFRLYASEAGQAEAISTATSAGGATAAR